MDRRTDRRTDMIKVVVALLNFCERTYTPEVLEVQPFSLRVSKPLCCFRRSTVWNADISALAFTSYCVARSVVSWINELIIRVSFCRSWWL